MTVTLGRPQVVLLALMAVGYLLCFRLAVLREGNSDGMGPPQTLALVAVETIVAFIVLALLWAGGFFKG